MDIRRLQGWALIIGAMTEILLFILNWAGITNRIQYAHETLALVYSVLFILGLPAIQTTQPQTKRWGKIGLVLMFLPLAHQFIFELINILVAQPLQINQLADSIWFPLESMGVAYSGYLLVGWLTIRARVFPAWIGWFLLTSGVLLTALLVLPIDLSTWPQALANFLLLIIRFTEVVALAGYGWGIIRYRTYSDINQISILKNRSDIKGLIEILVKENQADWEFRLDTAEALAQIGNEQGMNYLISALEAPDAEVRDVAREILEGLGDQQNNLVFSPHPPK